jgi:hypothetical protein
MNESMPEVATPGVDGLKQLQRTAQRHPCKWLLNLSRDVFGVFDPTHTIHDYLSCFA